MSFSEQLDQLNRQLATRLDGVVDDLRRAYAERLRSAHSSALRSLEEFAPAVPSDLIPPETLAALAAAAAPPPPAAPPRAGTDELLEALRRIDAARMQTDLLEALLEGARRFCRRAALLITSAEGTRGWAASGFGPGLLALDDLTLRAEPGSPLARLLDGQGAVALSGDECTALVGTFSEEAALGGVLVPIVLRDRLAAALYADQANGAEVVDLAALQVLAFAAAQTLELLGLRERAVTPTLYAAGAAPIAPLSLWSEAPQAPAGEEAPVPVATEAPAPVVTEEPAPEPSGEAARPFAAEPEPAPPTAPAPAPVAEPSGPTWGLVAEPVEETLFYPEAAALAPAPVAEPVAEPSVEPIAEEPVWLATEDDTAVSRVAIAEAGEVWTEPVFELEEEEAEQTFELAPEEPAVEAPVEPVALAPDEIFPPVVAPPAPALAPPPPEETTSPLPISPTPWAGPAATQRIPVLQPPPPARADLSEDETVMIPRSGLPSAAEVPSPFATSPTPAPTPPATGSLAGGWPAGDRTATGRGAEVLPPPDLQGPGWAFTASRTPVVAGDEALHEEARRLARLLVSEIKLYNEEQVEEGRRSKDIYSRLREDIDRSRQLYDERVHERVRAGADYFQQELVRNLAGGDASALGR